MTCVYYSKGALNVLLERSFNPKEVSRLMTAAASWSCSVEGKSGLHTPTPRVN